MDVIIPPTDHIYWKPCYRIIPSRFPPANIYERVADDEDIQAITDIENLTNQRIRTLNGELPSTDLSEFKSVLDPTVLAPFTYLNPEGSRFSNGSFGVYYASGEMDTAVAETCYHREVFLSSTKEEPIEIDMRIMLADLEGTMHSLIGLKSKLPQYHENKDYSQPQSLGLELKKIGSNGIVYESVRHQGGHCAAVYHPQVLSRCRQGRHLCYVWDGSRIAYIYEKKIYRGHKSPQSIYNIELPVSDKS